MALSTMLQYGAFLLIVTALVYPVGSYLTRVFAGGKTVARPRVAPPGTAVLSARRN